MNVAPPTSRHSGGGRQAPDRGTDTGHGGGGRSAGATRRPGSIHGPSTGGHSVLTTSHRRPVGGPGVASTHVTPTRTTRPDSSSVSSVTGLVLRHSMCDGTYRTVTSTSSTSSSPSVVGRPTSSRGLDSGTGDHTVTRRVSVGRVSPTGPVAPSATTVQGVGSVAGSPT